MIASTSNRSGQPQPREGTVAIGSLVQLVEGAGGIAEFLTGDYCPDLDLSRAEIEEAFSFCAQKACTQVNVVEFCIDCRMFIDGCKSAKSAGIRESEIVSGHEGLVLWQKAAEFLVAEGIDPHVVREFLVDNG